MAIFNKPSFNKIWASLGIKTTPPDAKIDEGWVVEKPAFQYENWSQNRQDAYLAHLNQRGIPEWDAEGDYLNRKSYVQRSNGVLYTALQHSIGEDPTTTGGFWEPFGKSGYALTVAPGIVASDGAYYLDGTFTTTLPDTTGLANGDTVKFIKDILETPIIEVDGTNSENILTENGTDTSVFFDINSEIIFVFNGTNWEV
jgi:hypothetical protein